MKMTKFDGVVGQREFNQRVVHARVDEPLLSSNDSLFDCSGEDLLFTALIVLAENDKKTNFKHEAFLYTNYQIVLECKKSANQVTSYPMKLVPRLLSLENTSIRRTKGKKIQCS